MTDGQLNANVDAYLQAAAMNTPPPQIMSDPLVTGVTPIEQLLRVLGLAANLGDPQDNAESIDEHAKRDTQANEAAEKFGAQDQEAADELNSVGEQLDPATTAAGAGNADPASAMAQQLPQAMSSIAGALSGALGGALQPLAQIPQQVAQGAQQAMQTGAGMLQQFTGPATGALDDPSLDAISPLDDFDTAPADFGGLSGGGGSDEYSSPGIDGLGGSGSEGPGSTAPMALLGPPAIPSAGTAPSSAPFSQISAPTPPTANPTGGPGMAGMPMVPPGAMAGAAGTDKDAKADTRRVSVPPVRNGAPVQGRLTLPPSLPQVTKSVDGKPSAGRRIILPPKGTTDTISDS